jgi:hypothetical protein
MAISGSQLKATLYLRLVLEEVEVGLRCKNGAWRIFSGSSSSLLIPRPATYPYVCDGEQRRNGRLAMQCDKGDGIIGTYLVRW